MAEKIIEYFSNGERFGVHIDYFVEDKPLGKDGAYFDGIYFCPHHTDSSFDSEVKEFKFNCGCRKPKPGMLLQAAKDFNIDLTQSYMIGDGEHDKGAGEAAGYKTKIIPTDGDLLKAVEEILEDTYD